MTGTVQNRILKEAIKNPRKWFPMRQLDYSQPDAWKNGNENRAIKELAQLGFLEIQELPKPKGQGNKKNRRYRLKITD
jgi:hypothetical protein